MSTTTTGTASLPPTTGPSCSPAPPSCPASSSARSSGRPAPSSSRRRSSADVPEAERPAERARFVAAAETVAGRLTERAAAATGVSAEVLSTTAGLARDRGLLSAVEQRIDAGAPAAVATVAGRPAVRGHVHRARRADGRAGHRRPRRPGPDRRRPDRAGRAGRPEPRRARRCCSPTTWRRPTRPAWTRRGSIGLATRLGGTTSHTAIIARQLGLPCVVAVGGLDDVPDGVTVLLDGEQGTVTVDPDPPTPRRGSARPASPPTALAGYAGPATTSDGHAVQVLANVQDGAGARAAVAAHAEGVGLFRTELSLPRARPGADGGGAGGRLRGGASTPSPGARSCSARWTPARTSRWPSPRCPTRPTRHWGSAACGSPGATPDMLDRQLDAVAEAARRTSSDAVGDGADGGHRRGGGRLRGPGARPRARAGRDDRGALGGAARRPAARARRLPVDRHQRPVAVHAGRRPAVRRPGRPHRPVAARAPAAGRA